LHLHAGGLLRQERLVFGELPDQLPHPALEEPDREAARQAFGDALGALVAADLAEDRRQRQIQRLPQLPGRLVFDAVGQAVELEQDVHVEGLTLHRRVTLRRARRGQAPLLGVFGHTRGCPE
jgi:hypothetical protein